MAQRKGQTGNPHGRPKGAKNKRTKEQLERVEWALSVLDDTLEKDIKAMSETERVKLWAVLQEFVRPKLSRTDTNVKADIETTIKVIRE